MREDEPIFQESGVREAIKTWPRRIHHRDGRRRFSCMRGLQLLVLSSAFGQRHNKTKYRDWKGDRIYTVSAPHRRNGLGGEPTVEILPVRGRRNFSYENRHNGGIMKSNKMVSACVS
jgi:hypothetical protein